MSEILSTEVDGDGYASKKRSVVVSMGLMRTGIVETTDHDRLYDFSVSLPESVAKD